MLRRFKKAYEACETDQFTFDSNLYVKAFAKYLIEYLESKLVKS